MKIKLLNDGGYATKDIMEFPVIVDGFSYDGINHAVGVTISELVRVGFKEEHLDYDYFDLAFLVGEECEIVDE